jgi:hypothetical protein
MADIRETLQHMLEYFVPKDKDNDDTDFHTQARTQSQEPMDTAYNKDFTIEEIRNAVESMGNKKAPREDRIMCKIYKSTFEIFPSYITAFYNGCLRRGIFPRWKRAKLISSYMALQLLYRVLAFSTKSFHLLLSWSRVFQFGTFIFCISFLTSSPQRIFGLPIGLLEMGFQEYIAFTILVPCILSM